MTDKNSAAPPDASINTLPEPAESLEGSINDVPVYVSQAPSVSNPTSPYIVKKEVTKGLKKLSWQAPLAGATIILILLLFSGIYRLAQKGKTSTKSENSNIPAAQVMNSYGQDGQVLDVNAKLRAPALEVTGTSTFENITVKQTATVQGSLTVAGQATLGTTNINGSANVSGTVTATTLQGSGGGITNLNASNITSGTLAPARLPGGGQINIVLGSGLVGGGAVELGGSLQIGLQNTGGTPSLAVLQGGNSFGQDLTIGTTDNAGIMFQVGATTVAELTNNGAIRLRNRANSLLAFQLQNAAGTNYFVGDSIHQRIGIGTDTPTERLHVVGNVRLEGTVTSGDLLPLTAGSSILGFTSTPVASNIDTPGGLYNDSQSAIAVDASGLSHMVYIESGTFSIGYIRCLDVNCTTKSVSQIATAADFADSPTIQFGSDGMLRLLYNVYTTMPEIHLLRCLNTDCSSSIDTIIYTGISSYFYNLTFKLNGQNFPIVAFSDYAATDFWYLACQNLDCTSSVTNPVYTDDFSNGLSLDLDSNGLARISFAYNNTLHLAFCNDTACTNPNIVNTGAAVTGYYVESYITNTDLTRVTVMSGYNLYLFQCDDAVCSTHTLLNLEQLTGTGNSALAIKEINGNTAIVYAYTSSYEVFYLYCANPTCTSHTTVQIEDNDGAYPFSLTSDTVSGMPRVMYAGSDSESLYHVVFGTYNGLPQSVSGSNIGTSTNLFGSAYLQQLHLQYVGMEAIATLDQQNEYGSLLDLQLKGVTVSKVQATEQGVDIQNASGQSLLLFDTTNNGVRIGAGGTSATALQVVDSTNIQRFGVDTVTGTTSVGDATIETLKADIDPLGDAPMTYYPFDDTVDVNDDSVNDLLMQNDDQTVDIFLSTANNYHLAATVGTIGNSYYGGYFGDADADGDVDVYVWAYDVGVEVYLNDGSNHFSYDHTFTVAGYLQTFLVKDMNNDQRSDIAYGTNSTSLTIALSNGNGTYNSVTTTHNLGFYFTIGKFNNDAYLDIVATNGDKLYLLLGTGTGSFNGPYSANNNTTGLHPSLLYNADFNQDGYEDLYGYNNNNTAISVYLNNKNNTFANPDTYALGKVAQGALKVLNFNDDSAPDLLAERNTILVNNGLGKFTTKRTYTNEIYSTVDFNKDGFDDFIYRGNSAFVYALSYNPAISRNESSALKVYATNGYAGQTIVVSSVESDALLVQDRSGKTLARIANNGSLSLGFSQSEAQFTKVVSSGGVGYFNTTAGYEMPVTSDLNKDGLLDVIYMAYNPIDVAINQGNGRFVQTAFGTGYNSSSSYMTLGDVNGDTYDDIVAFASTSTTRRVYVNNHSGGFSALGTFTNTLDRNPYASKLVDFDHDGDNDLVQLVGVYGSYPYSLYIDVYTNNGSGTFALGTSTFVMNFTYGPNTAEFVDVTNDGNVDLLFSYNNEVRVYVNQSGSFPSFTSYTMPQGVGYARKIVAKDFNKDGNVDMFLYLDTGNPGNNIPPAIYI